MRHGKMKKPTKVAEPLPLLRSAEPVEQLTFLSGIQRWLFNTYMNVHQILPGERVLELLDHELHVAFRVEDLLSGGDVVATEVGGNVIR